jgi:acetyl esterase/lipase
VSAEPFHPELRRAARLLPRSLGSPYVTWLSRRLEPLVEARRPATLVGSETNAAVRARIHRPPNDSRQRAAFLWIHGGGYVIGHPSQDDHFCQDLARKLDILVVAVRYRLAPEHPFPAGLHDCHDALVWLASRPDVDATRIAIGGASAGGGLAASLALLARDRGEVRPALQLLSYPMLDDRTVLRGDLDERYFRMWNNRSNLYGWRSYLNTPPGSVEVSPLAAPSRCEDLSNLPPAWLGVGTLDLFHAEVATYAERLEKAGVPCRLNIVQGAFHAFDAIASRADVSRAYRADQIQALKSALHA